MPSGLPAVPFSGLLNLNGFTLTKLGANRLGLQDVVATNSGSLNIGAGFFAMINSIVDDLAPDLTTRNSIGHTAAML